MLLFLVLDFRQTLGMNLYITAEDVILWTAVWFLCFALGLWMVLAPYTSPIMILICHFSLVQNP